MTTTPTSLRRAALVGARAGVIASLAMAMYAMIAAYAKDTGFFTPLYHIASLVSDDSDMMTSMMAAAVGGDSFTFLAGPALLGAMIHMMTGALFGGAFGLVVARLRLGLAPLAGISLGYGLVVFVVSAYVALPLAAAVFGSGDAIKDMAQLAGWGTFIVEHLLFGLVLGVVTALGRRAGARVPEHAAAH